MRVNFKKYQALISAASGGGRQKKKGETILVFLSKAAITARNILPAICKNFDFFQRTILCLTSRGWVIRLNPPTLSPAVSGSIIDSAIVRLNTNILKIAV
jgi:hypothetical protein